MSGQNKTHEGGHLALDAARCPVGPVSHGPEPTSALGYPFELPLGEEGEFAQVDHVDVGLLARI